MLLLHTDKLEFHTPIEFVVHAVVEVQPLSSTEHEDQLQSLYVQFSLQEKVTTESQSTTVLGVNVNELTDGAVVSDDPPHQDDDLVTVQLALHSFQEASLQ